jgi:hypothetical protein
MNIFNIVRPVYADVDFGNRDINPIAKFRTIGSFTDIVIPAFMIVGGLVSLTMLLLGAYKYLTSEGKPEQISKAQSTIIYAVIGLFLIVASFILTKVVGWVLQVNMPL